MRVAKKIIVPGKVYFIGDIVAHYDKSKENGMAQLVVKKIEVPNYRDENKPVIITFHDGSTAEIMGKEYTAFYDKPNYKIIGGKQND